MKRDILASNQTLPALVTPTAVIEPRRVILGVLTRRRTPASRRMAESDLRQIAQALGVGDWRAIPWHQMRAEHLEVLRELLAETRSPVTVNRILSTARAALRRVYLLGGLTDREWAAIEEVDAAKGSREPRGRYITPGEQRALFTALATDPSPKARRDAAVLAVGLGCGLRRSEIVRLTLADYADGELRVLGKGNRERRQPVGADVAAYLTDWLAVRGRRDGPLFLAFDGKGQSLRLAERPLTAQAVYLICREWARRAGVPTFSPHDLRRTFVSSLLEVVDIALVAELAGHAQVQTTRRYDRRPAEAKRKAAERLTLPVIRPNRRNDEPQT